MIGEVCAADLKVRWTRTRRENGQEIIGADVSGVDVAVDVGRCKLLHVIHFVGVCLWFLFSGGRFFLITFNYNEI